MDSLPNIQNSLWNFVDFLLLLPEKVENGAEVLPAPVDQDPAVAVGQNLTPTRGCKT